MGWGEVMGWDSVSGDFPPWLRRVFWEGAWVYLLGCPVPAWVGLDIVLNGVTAEKGGRENQNLPSVSISGSTSAPAPHPPPCLPVHRT